MGAIKREERIGNQRLILGDCRECLEYVQYDAIASDPPYGMNFQSNHRTVQHEKIANDDGVELLQWCVRLPAEHSKYIWMRWDNIYDVPKPKSLITWVKNNWSMGDLLHEHGRQTEVCAFWPGESHEWGNGRPSDVVNCARTGNEYHPTEKPIQLMQTVIGWTKGVIFDPFMGSGSTIVAAEKMGRKGVGVEINPEYFEIACKRVDEATRQPDMFVSAPVAAVKQEELF